ncbi:hypothetical protein ACQQ2T_07850 [Paraclostridium tenue]|uniref:Uncharacterized protein n=1 Tax=Paeniclostridium hominis TaxID=2764329 RepID=A0ABR7K318_9FIRM|nr:MULTISPECIES: hypothetical protein [Paeniclostridium]MBC6003377.1 hypothetical protein [Paeniclostridium hominis]
MKNAFIFRGDIYSFKKADIGVYIDVCKYLDINIVELHRRLNDADLEAMLTVIYYSLSNSKELTIEDLKSMSLEEYELVSQMFSEVQK